MEQATSPASERANKQASERPSQTVHTSMTMHLVLQLIQVHVEWLHTRGVNSRQAGRQAGAVQMMVLSMTTHRVRFAKCGIDGRIRLARGLQNLELDVHALSLGRLQVARCQPLRRQQASTAPATNNNQQSTRAAAAAGLDLGQRRLPKVECVQHRLLIPAASKQASSST